MSEIPYVNRLGDELERMARARRRRLRRRIALGGLGLALTVSGVAAASGVFGEAETLATQGVACYERASLDGGAVVLPAGDATPVDACERALGTGGPRVACSAGDHVAVLPGRDGCERAGLRPLPDAYAGARERVLALERALKAVEARCVAPPEMAARTQRLLDRLGWAGWRAELRLDIEDGPCGYATALGGSGRRSLEGGLDTDGRRVMVTGGPRPER